MAVTAVIGIAEKSWQLKESLKRWRAPEKPKDLGFAKHLEAALKKQSKADKKNG